jgi:uncharacterized protein involved in copper resistance
MSTRFLNGKQPRKPSQLANDWSKSLDESELKRATSSLGPTVTNITTTTSATPNQHQHTDDDTTTTSTTNINSGSNTTTDVHNTAKREAYKSWRFALPHIQHHSKQDNDNNVGDNKRKSTATPIDLRSVDAW